MNVLKPALIAVMLMAQTNAIALAGPKHCPPGHAKKGWCQPGSVSQLPPGIRMKVLDRWYDHDLRPPRRGEEYVIVDDQLYLIITATREILEAIGAVSRVLN